MKKITFVMLIVTGALFLGLGSNSKSLMADTSAVTNSVNRDNYLNIITTNKMQSNMIKELSGDKHNVNHMFNSENDIKKYKITDDAIKNISNMDLFFYSGNNLEPWIGDLTSKLDKNSVSVEDLSRGVRNKNYTVDEEVQKNPYYWTSINNYKVMLYNAKSLLQENDPANRNYYENNYNKMLKEIDEVEAEFDKTKGLDKYTFVVRSDKFNYFLDSIGIKYTVLGKNESIKSFAKKNNINEKNIVLIKDKNSKLNKYDAKFKVVNLEVYNNNKTYMELIESNLKALEGLAIKK